MQVNVLTERHTSTKQHIHVQVEHVNVYTRQHDNEYKHVCVQHNNKTIRRPNNVLEHELGSVLTHPPAGQRVRARWTMAQEWPQDDL